MSCRICSSTLNHINKLPANFVWEDLVNAILPQLVLDAIPSKEICCLCYGKLQKFNLYRNVYSQNEKIYAEKKNMPLCRMCKIDISSAGISCNSMSLRHINLLKIFIPDMHLDLRITTVLCEPCEALLTEFNDFLNMMIFNEAPSTSCNNVNDNNKNSCKEFINELINTNGEVIKNKYANKSNNKLVIEIDAKNAPEKYLQESKSTDSNKEMSHKYKKCFLEGIIEKEEINLKPVIKCQDYCDNIRKYNMNNCDKGMPKCKKDDCDTNKEVQNDSDEFKKKTSIMKFETVDDTCNNSSNVRNTFCEESSDELLDTDDKDDSEEKNTDNTYCNSAKIISNENESSTCISKLDIEDLQKINPTNLKNERFNEECCSNAVIDSEEVHIKIEFDDQKDCDKNTEDCDNTTTVEYSKECDNKKVQNTKKREKRKSIEEVERKIMNKPIKIEDIEKTDRLNKVTRISYLCHYCCYKACNLKDLEKHHRMKHNGQVMTHQCPFCLYSTTNRKYLTNHCKYMHKENPRFYNCSLCIFKTKRQEHLKKHLNKHYGNVTYKCAMCNFETKWRYSLQCHIIAKHDTKQEYTKCEFCDFKSKIPNDLKKHLQYKHDKDKHLKCSECDFHTNFQGYLNKHMKLQHLNNSLYKCEMCDFQTRFDQCLKKHKRFVHTKDNILFKCPYCDHKTKYKGNLAVHHKLKHEIDCETFGCSQCSYRTKMKGDLKKHIAYNHTVCKYYNCVQCEYKSKKIYHLKEHIKLKHSNHFQIFTCPHCSYKSKYKYNLIMHVKNKHKNDRKCHRCKLCKHTTKYKNNLKMHYKKKHNLNEN